ncbi:hypothetical protein A1O1_01085 [Capronia coronata CBS 617.96]|uniref:Thymocyte nuclear protein 1 n=1 Tax=Capronia coronata CBS 617.96 TaxID=1182541 RepID=W9Z1Z6_9EURO|nr:uncharacterized protein A1O1_01085 [Capronia coronata CBS 617.96]EXJ95960.1 hypothetical protein A1O1_01085 [Capronia coronata CBS 617.96]
MPPKKRKATSAAKTTPAKKVRIGSITSEPSNIPAALSPSGRPRRTSVSEPKYDFTRHPQPRKKVGLPSRADTAAARTAKGKSSTTTSKKAAGPRRTGTASSASHAPTLESALKTTSSPQTPKRRGRPPKVKSGPESHLSNGSNHPIVNINSNATSSGENKENVDTDIQYWLMKAEPESRLEKGHDVKFSIDDLMERTEPEPWDGVRNPVARNNMRAMRKGDLAFFYHSNCKVPGIAGVMRIVGEHTVDESAFDPNHPYYDPKSDRSKPKWDVVHVEFVKKFDDLITLKTLRSLAHPSGVLQDMQMLKQSRLSVSSVTPTEWEFILQLAGEPLSLGRGAAKDGYESDVDGEGDETAADVDVATNGATNGLRRDENGVGEGKANTD